MTLTRENGLAGRLSCPGKHGFGGGTAWTAGRERATLPGRYWVAAMPRWFPARFRSFRGLRPMGVPRVSWLWLINRVWFPFREVWSRSRPAGCVACARLLATWWPMAAAPAPTSAGIAWTRGDAPNAGLRVRPGRLTSATAVRATPKRQGRRLTCLDATRPAPVSVPAAGAASHWLPRLRISAEARMWALPY
jgi:hypothetical protein